VRSGEDIRAAGHELRTRLGADGVLITRGDKGMMIFLADGSATNIPVSDHSEIFDVSGAGDTCVAVMILALAAGIADGLGYGDNTKAALITRGIAETARLGVKIGAHWETFAGLTGIGDLIVPCASMHSRNRRAGSLIGQGKPVEEAMREVGQVVEGVYSAKAALALAEREQVEMPIVEVVNRVLFSGLPAAEAVQMLMERDPVAEWNHL